MADPARQVQEWLERYDSPSACVAHLLCDRHPADATAVTEVDADLSARDLTYGELAERSSAVAGGLAELGVRPGDRVATLMDGGIDLAVTALAVWRLGAVHVPLFTAFAPSAIALRLRDSGARAVVCGDDQRPKLDPGSDLPADSAPAVVTTGAAPLRPGDRTLADLERARPAPAAATGGAAPFLRLYASGTAGPPRAVEVPVRALAALHVYHHYGLDVRDDDVFWNAADPGWFYGVYHGLVSPLLAGHRSLHLRAGFDPELTLDVLATYEVTNFAATPTVYRALRSVLKTLPPEVVVRRLASSGEPLHADVVRWAEDVFGVPVHDHYGQSELGMCAGNHSHDEVAVPLKPGSMGTALPGWTVTVLEPVDDVEAAPGVFGRVAVDTAASPAMWFAGYQGSPLATARRFSPDHRWYLTGDTGTRDAAGRLYFSSRDDDVILTGGYRITPFDVESALLQHPDVEETAAYGVPDDVVGEVVAADVVLREGVRGSDELAEALRELVRARIASHAGPGRINFVAQLPRTASGKIQRFRLRGPRQRA
ncbi:AMP-binding protein [Marinitenerispora sediminis]|uniref:AMP-dependent synthetase n=1 Tax=Marinitenerispora sediminis TaxID=1931232 RepID=A0A368T7S0_9ACTN|nr:AMP-binding protein [Marinitenerispora sediminis]RCV49600.1 AMP-dependent synthetase [Marinitenerispora sediminis]RCV53056.1 AMP-dependent synthetase [Marinitenerispora sediminis]RCV59801.1 AMP-dependent synthetase [Marinitenerispora sediminis]